MIAGGVVVRQSRRNRIPVPDRTTVVGPGLRPIILLCVAGVLGLSCAPPPPRRDWNPAMGYEKLLEAPLEQLEQLQDLTAEARLTLRVDGREQRATALVQLMMPDLMKLEVRGPFLSHILTVVLSADTLFVHGPAAAGNWQGAVDGSLLEFLTGLDLGGYDLRYALLGLVERAPVDTRLAPEFPRGDRVIIALQMPPGYCRRIWVNLHRGLVTREEVVRDGSNWALIRQLRDYRSVGTMLLPRTVEILQGGASIKLEYQRYRLNTGLRRSAFEAAMPPGEIRRLD